MSRHWSARTRRRSFLALVLSVAALLGACGSDDGDPAASNATSTSATATASAPTTTTTTEPGRAFVTASTVRPIVTPTPGEAEGDGSVDLDALAVGDCADLPGLGQPDSVEVDSATLIPCDEPHSVEVFAVVSLNDDPAAAYPGDDVVLAAADETCLAAFGPFVGVEYVESSLEIVHLRPDETVWARGDRIVRCAVYERTLAPLVGSVAGSNR